MERMSQDSFETLRSSGSSPGSLRYRESGPRWSGASARWRRVLRSSFGRDIGTVVLPDAGLKVYLEASVEVRARRRHRELEARGDPPPLEQVVDDLTRRDSMDSQRADSPLRAAHDAVRIFTDALDVEGVVERIMELIDHPHPGPLPSRERG
jgi:hypothetical protein